MVGAITGWDILAHPLVTVQCFGWRVFFKALFVGQHQTFLSLLPKTDSVSTRQPTTRLSGLVDRCVDLELRAKRVYMAFSDAFADWPETSRFFDALAQQEQDHADLLALCSDAVHRGSWMADCYNPWEDYVPSLEEHMKRVEIALYDVDALDEALRLVIQIESAEINRVFQGVLAACDSPFINSLAAFREAMEKHISYIATRLPELDPQFALASRELRGMFLRTV